MDKEKYTHAELEILMFDTEDIILTSGEDKKYTPEEWETKFQEP